MKCIKGYTVEILASAAGFYCGTEDSEGFPNCRISRDYAKTKDEAKNLPLNRQTGCIKNEFCNKGRGGAFSGGF